MATPSGGMIWEGHRLQTSKIAGLGLNSELIFYNSMSNEFKKLSENITLLGKLAYLDGSSAQADIFRASVQLDYAF